MGGVYLNACEWEVAMPVYNYVCKVCGAHFEYRHSFQDADQPTMCPNGHLQTRKVLSVPSVVFKGSGFYVTDHRAKGAVDKGN